MKKQEPVGGSAALPEFLTGLWAFLMLTFFPLYVHDGYSGMGLHKFRFFLSASLCCLAPAAICLLWRAGKGGRESLGRLCGSLSALDRAMLVYLLTVCISWCMSVDKRQAWTGAQGWFCGLRTQMLLVLSYFLVSRHFPWKKMIFAGHFCSSAAVFLLGVLHRFQIDPLGMYEGVEKSWQLLFLSTIGQASWYSGYVCIVLVIGVTAWYLTPRKGLRVALSAYCSLGFAAVVTQNSDSAFAAMGALLLGLFVVSCDSLDRMERFLELVLIMLGSFKLVGLLQLFWKERAVRLGELSEFWSRSTVSWVILLAACLIDTAFLFYRQKYPEKTVFRKKERLRRLALGLTAVCVCAGVGLIWLNTAGVLERFFGWKSGQQYLLFDAGWGNSRGFIWRFALRGFGEFSFMRKLFGVGPDCFSAWCYGDSALAGELMHYFGRGQTLTNAHNEFLNTLFCTGAFGLTSFCMIFGAALGRFWKRRNSFALAGMLAVLVYASHNFFCYQQVCCTPFLFLLLGLAENLARKKVCGPLT